MKNLIFDLDGTLGDSLPICLQAFKETVEPYTGKKLSDKEIEKHFGISEEGMMQNLLPENYNEAMQDYVSCYSSILEEKSAPFSGVNELLEKLHNYDNMQIFMVTGKGKVSADITLEKYNLSSYFKDICYGSPAGGIKDECINSLVDKYNLDRMETYYIGDAVSDVEVSRKCNIGIIAAGWASTADIPALEASRPDYLFTSFADFKDFVLDYYNMN